MLSKKGKKKSTKNNIDYQTLSPTSSKMMPTIKEIEFHASTREISVESTSKDL